MDIMIYFNSISICVWLFYTLYSLYKKKQNKKNDV